MSWIGDKFRDWLDGGVGSIENTTNDVLTPEELLKREGQ